MRYLLLSLLLMSSACSLFSEDRSVSKLSQPPEGMIAVKVIDASHLDGCQYLLETEDGRRMQALNLDKSYRQKGKRLFVAIEPTQTMMSICMAGPIVRIKEVIAKD